MALNQARKYIGLVLEIRRKWFSNRLLDEWNELSNQVVSAKTIGNL